MGNSTTRFAKVKSIVHKMNSWALTLGMGWVLVMMFLTTLDVGGRYFFSSPVPGTIEMSEFMLAMFGVLGIAYTHEAGGNVKVTMLTGKLPVRASSFLDLITGLLSLQIVSMLAWYGVVMAMDEYKNGTTTDTLGIPIFPLDLLLSVGAFLLVLEILITVISAGTTMFTGKMATNKN
ncbi:MAG: TRAP transporter small permease [Desulfobacterium sp.]